MSSELPIAELIAWVHGYDGYKRLAAEPRELERLLAGARREYLDRGVIPTWCGVDLLKGWAFLLVRSDRFAGGQLAVPGSGTHGEWRAVLDALGAHPAASIRDRPPSVPPAEKVYSAAPRAHRDPEFLAAKQARLREPHVEPINELVRRIVESGKGDVPYIDPDGGGIGARALFVLEAPARAAAHGSGMLSADNDDATAAHVWECYQHAGLPRSWGVHWNAVPWYVGKKERIRAVTPVEVEQGRRWLVELLEMLPELRVVLTMGVPARKALVPLEHGLRDRGVAVINTWHPSPRNYNSRPHSRAAVLAAFDQVREAAT